MAYPFNSEISLTRVPPPPLVLVNREQYSFVDEYSHKMSKAFLWLTPCVTITIYITVDLSYMYVSKI